MNQPAWGATGREVYERTYSRLQEDGTQETWADTVQRVVDGNLALVPAEFELEGEREALLDAIFNFRIIPAGRHLWTSGVRGRQFNRNCHRAGWTADLADHFTFMFDELMKGGGVGSNYSADYMDRAQPISTLIDLRVTCDPLHPDVDEVKPDPILADFNDITLQVSDSREGWVHVVRQLIHLATHDGGMGHLVVTVDVSAVRQRGAALRGFGGTASGPGPLVDALRLLVKLLNEARGGKLTGMQAMRIDHALAQCVVAGNIRRSARMSVMHWSDPSIFNFINCKADHTEHWTTNISVEVDAAYFAALDAQEPGALAVRDAVLEGMMLNGEPGFFNSSLASEGERGDVRCTNPCGEIALEEWESCNLGHVNLAQFDRFDTDMCQAFVLMARFLVRATFAELLNPMQAEVEERNRRIGVGIFGFQEWLVKQGIPYSLAAHSPHVVEDLEAMAFSARRAADFLADQLGIPRPVKHTTVAPTGTVAKLPGVTEGIHPIYSRYFVRRVRYSNGDPLLDELVAKGYETEPCQYNPDTTVVLFHVRDSIVDVAPEHVIEQADELSVIDKLGVQALVQEHYADNAVSYTVNLQPSDTEKELAWALDYFLPDLKGTTVFPPNTRPQSPYTAITRAEYEAATDHDVAQSFDECASGACPVR